MDEDRKDIKVEIIISNVQDWDVDWVNDTNEELAQLTKEIKYFLTKYIGIQSDELNVKSELI